MRIGRLQTFMALLMAFAVFAILVSPAVPSPLTTLRSKQVVQPPHAIAPAAALLYTAAVQLAPAAFVVMQDTRAAAGSGSAIVDLTTARLC